MNLTDRIEAAEGPSRELFEQAWEAIPLQAGCDPDAPICPVCARFDALLNAEAWLDAAMMLVPEHIKDNWFVASAGPSFDKPVAGFNMTSFWWGGEWDHHGSAATPALALCAAALRARGEG